MKLKKFARLSVKAATLASLTLGISNTAFAHMFYQAQQALSAYTLDCAYWYVGANLGLSHVHDNVTAAVTNSSMNEYGPGWAAYGGYRFNSILGLELGYTQYYRSRETAMNSTGGSFLIAKTDHLSAYTAVTGRLPLVNKFSAIGKLGIAYSYAYKESVGAITTFSSEAVGPYAGLGVAYSVTRSADIVGEWAYARGNHYTGSTELWSLGVTFGIV